MSGSVFLASPYDTLHAIATNRQLSLVRDERSGSVATSTGMRRDARLDSTASASGGGPHNRRREDSSAAGSERPQKQRSSVATDASGATHQERHSTSEGGGEGTASKVRNDSRELGGSGSRRDKREQRSSASGAAAQQHHSNKSGTRRDQRRAPVIPMHRARSAAIIDGLGGFKPPRSGSFGTQSSSDD